MPRLDDPNALALLGSLSDATLPHTAAIQDRTTTRGDGGTHTSTWATAASVACRLTPASASEQQIAAARRVVATWTLVLPSGTPIAYPQRIVVTGTDAAANAFTVTLQPAVILGPAAAEALRKVLCADYTEPS